MAFGNFEATLVDIPDEIGDTIPRFHDISFRLEQLDDAVAADAAGRACEVTELVNAIRSRAAVERIAQLEQLQVSEDEMGQALALVARQNQLTVEQLKEYYDAELEKAVMNRVLTGKVMGLIRDAADITVVS